MPNVDRELRQGLNQAEQETRRQDRVDPRIVVLPTPLGSEKDDWKARVLRKTQLENRGTSYFGSHDMWGRPI